MYTVVMVNRRVADGADGERLGTPLLFFISQDSRTETSEAGWTEFIRVRAVPNKENEPAHLS